MAESADLKTIKQLHEASGVSTGTIDRIRRAQVSAGVDQLTALAKPFGLEPWQLLEQGVKARSKEAQYYADLIDKMRPEERRKLDHAFAIAVDTDLEELKLRERNVDTGLGEFDDKPTGTK